MYIIQYYVYKVIFNSIYMNYFMLLLDILLFYRFGYSRGIPRRTKSKDDDTHSESPSPLRITGIDDTGPDGNGELVGNSVDRSMPAPEEPPYFPEQW